MRHGLPQHECARFWRRGLDCPFGPRIPGEEEDPDKQGGEPSRFRPVAVGRKRNQLRANTNAVGEAEGNIIRLADYELYPEELQRAAIRNRPIQAQGGLSSIPNFEQLLQGRTPRAMMGLLTGLALAEGFRRSRGMSFRDVGTGAKMVEQRVAQRLSSLSGIGKSGGGQSTGRGGRGGFLVNDAANLRGLLGLAPNRKLRRKYRGSRFSGAGGDDGG